MARLTLTKASLSKQKQQLGLFEQVLPSLDLKRRQLAAERAKARQSLAATKKFLQDMEPEVASHLPMLSNELVDLTDIVKVGHVELVEENVMGTRLPKLNRMEVEVRPYALLSKPFWVDRLVEFLKEALEAEVQLQVAQRRLELLEKAERTVTQRFNLFDKVLIPRTKTNIKKIEIYLSDMERAAVVNSKIAKGKKKKLESP